MNLFTKQKQTQKEQIMVIKEEVGGGINEKFGNNRCILLYIKQIMNKHLSYSKHIKYLVITYNGKESEKYIYMIYN